MTFPQGLLSAHSPKPRFALNFKRANFVTKWADVSEVTSTCKRLRIDPSQFFANGEPYHTVRSGSSRVNRSLEAVTWQVGIRG
ncbi:hypothetical protein F4678DRAFT_419210 [Xylaria arbuscula]|nr:hypothetical protein F4678DRAFT_419210 [Xylaria arbuscula]